MHVAVNEHGQVVLTPSIVPSTEGSPLEGQFDSNFEPRIQEAPEPHNGCEDAAHVYNAAFSQRMQLAIERAVPQHSGAWQEYCVYQKNLLERVSQMRHAASAVGTQLRKRGVADIGQGRGHKGQGKRLENGQSGQSSKRARDDFGGDRVLQLRDRIFKHGLPSGHYVQIENDKHQRWFMRVTNGKVLHKDTDDPALASALWCETHDVTKLSAKFTTAQECEIRSIIDSGPMSEFGR